MKSLDEHNRERREAYKAISGARPNGIACPRCGCELSDTDPFSTLTSSPPQKRVGCKCGYSGYRLA